MKDYIKAFGLIACVIIDVICCRWLEGKYGITKMDSFIALTPIKTAYVAYAYWLADTLVFQSAIKQPSKQFAYPVVTPGNFLR